VLQKRQRDLAKRGERRIGAHEFFEQAHVLEQQPGAVIEGKRIRQASISVEAEAPATADLDDLFERAGINAQSCRCSQGAVRECQVSRDERVVNCRRGRRICTPRCAL